MATPILCDETAAAEFDTVNLAASDVTLPESEAGGDLSIYMPTEGERLGNRYEIIKCVGLGGSCGVYKCIDHNRLSSRNVDPFVALKIPRPRFRENAAWLQTFEAEAAIALRLEHPHIIKVFGVNRDENGMVFIVMEYLRGASLVARTRAINFRGLGWAEVAPIVSALSDALTYMHGRGLVHRDLKPSNVFVSEQEEIKLIDFGIAGLTSSEGNNATLANRQATPAYASPAVLEGLAPDPRDDVYSFACTVYELLTGKHPFQYQRATAARGANSLVPQNNLSKATWRVFRQALAFDAASRTPTIRDFHRALERSFNPYIALLLKSTAIASLVAGVALLEYWPRGADLLSPSLTPKSVQSGLADDGESGVESSGSDGSAPVALSNDNEQTRPTTSAVVDAKPTSNGDEIDRLMALADQRLKSEAWVEPAEASALSAYQEILRRSPDHAPAQQGVADIKAHFLALADAASREGDWARVDRSIRSALLAVPNDMALQERLAQVQSQLNPTPVAAASVHEAAVTEYGQSQPVSGPRKVIRTKRKAGPSADRSAEAADNARLQTQANTVPNATQPSPALARKPELATNKPVERLPLNTKAVKPAVEMAPEQRSEPAPANAQAQPNSAEHPAAPSIQPAPDSITSSPETVTPAQPRRSFRHSSTF